MTKSPDITPALQIEINRANQIQKNRDAWIKALRENGHRQCQGALIIHSKVCALGLAFEMFGNWHLSIAPLRTAISVDNDAGWTFAQIADAAEQGRYW